MGHIFGTTFWLYQPVLYFYGRLVRKDVIFDTTYVRIQVITINTRKTKA